MLQFYFLSVLLNIITGLILVYAKNFIKPSVLGETALILADGDAENISDAQDAPLDKENAPEEESVSDIAEDSDDDLDIEDSAVQNDDFLNSRILNDSTFRLVIGILSGFTALMKFLTPVQNDVPVVGDLIPAIAGIAACITLLVEFYSRKSEVKIALPSFISAVVVSGRKYLGIFCILAGIIHFIFPRVLFL